MVNSTRPSHGQAPSSAAIVNSEKNYTFETVFADHVDLVWRVLRGMRVPEAAVADAAQEVFVVVFRRLHEFEHRSKLSTWIYSITYRVGSSHRRRSARYRVADGSAVAERGTSEDPEKVLLAGESQKRAARFLEGLSEEMRDIFILSLLEERSAAEVSEIMEIPVNTVYSRARLVREGFRNTLGLQKKKITKAAP